jgi:hypothetical protein
MEDKTKNILTVSTTIIITFLSAYILSLIPNYLRSPNSDAVSGLKFIIIFIIVDLILIGISFYLHKVYSKDYSKINNIWFFALFGGITGALLGEAGSVVMIIPYTILMLIYAFLYKKFTWWKVSLTSYLAGILIENGMNRAPLQSPTLLWIAFFTYPYFITKLFENRKEINFLDIIKDFKYAIISAPILMILAYLITRSNVSPPLIFLGAVLPFIIKILFLRKKD